MTDISIKKENDIQQTAHLPQNNLKLINQKELIAKFLKSSEEHPFQFNNEFVQLVEFHAEGMPDDDKIECFRRIIKTVINT